VSQNLGNGNDEDCSDDMSSTEGGYEEGDSQYEDLENTTNEDDENEADRSDENVTKESEVPTEAQELTRELNNHKTNGKPITIHNLKKLKLNSLSSKNKKLNVRLGLKQPKNGKAAVDAGGRVAKKPGTHNGKRLYIKHEKLDNLFKNGGLEILAQNDKNVIDMINECTATSMRSKFAPLLKNNKKSIDVADSNRNGNGSSLLPLILSRTKFAKKRNSSGEKAAARVSAPGNFSDSINIINNDPELEDAPLSSRKFLIKTTSTTGNPEHGSDNVFKCKNCRFLFLDTRLLYEHTQTCQIDYNNQMNAPAAKNRRVLHEHPEPRSATTTTTKSYVDAQSFYTCSFCKQCYPNKLSFVLHAVVCVNALDLISVSPSVMNSA
jgi:hypothetical protein